MRTYMNDKFKKHLFKEIGYTLRRYYIDEFYFRNIALLKKNSNILDIGGKKLCKRGYFNIDDYEYFVNYLNLEQNSRPDVICDAIDLPLKSNYYDGIILSEVLEHITNPQKVLTESYRVLNENGILFLTVPFMLFEHMDPLDFGRYTGLWFNRTLLEIGYKNISIERQGLFFSVLMNMMKLWCNEISKMNTIKSRLIAKFFHKIIIIGVKMAFIIESKDIYKNNLMFSGHTTGFGIICSK